MNIITHVHAFWIRSFRGNTDITEPAYVQFYVDYITCMFLFKIRS